MTNNESLFKSLSPSKIDSSVEIQNWLSQFSINDQTFAKLLLSRLKFISRDKYSEWLNKTILSIIDKQFIFALYSVRKLSQSGDYPSYWGNDKQVIYRPGESQGSEDLVYSLIANLVRANKDYLLDNPSLDKLKSNRVRQYILIDDSIGSGERISKFINSMLRHPTFLSWWNFGWINIHIVSFSRFHEAEKKIIMNIIGKDNAKQKIRKSSKIKFHSELVYHQNWIKSRWGENYEPLIEFCQTQKQIPPKKRLGYGDVFSNIIFYHSVPNNTPGIIWAKKSKSKWEPLMPNRTVPTWLIELLENNNDKIITTSKLSNELLDAIMLIKKGIRNPASLAQRLNTDTQYAKNLLEHMKMMGLINKHSRLTPRGLDIFHQKNIIGLQSWDYSMYIPRSWCAG
ncbi:TPA: phosphoribosyltransferase-like protein [Haemophilus influenzae]|uniref:phosphoribosyltransferase-like protein n=1 Tax=Haemophilus influenzae TaxID=727 RepID=UPI000DD47E64|nr:hypothetical protein [Haemophilus influenzae]